AVEEDRVVADDVAAAQREHADLVTRPRARLALASVDEAMVLPGDGLARRLRDLGEPQRGPARRVHLQAVVRLDDLDVVVRAERRDRLLEERGEDVDPN